MLLQIQEMPVVISKNGRKYSANENVPDIENSTDKYLIIEDILSNAIDKNFLVDNIIDELDIYSEIK